MGMTEFGGASSVSCSDHDAPIVSPGVYAFTKVSENEASPPDTTHSPRWYCKVCEGIEAIGIEEMLQDKVFPSKWYLGRHRMYGLLQHSQCGESG